jgi:hypothetical protein
MPESPSDPRQPRLASAPQLWRLNQLGRLSIVDDASPIDSSDAKAVIGAELERLGLPRFPRAGETSAGHRDSTRRDPVLTETLRAGGRG